MERKESKGQSEIDAIYDWIREVKIAQTKYLMLDQLAIETIEYNASVGREMHYRMDAFAGKLHSCFRHECTDYDQIIHYATLYFYSTDCPWKWSSFPGLKSILRAKSRQLFMRVYPQIADPKVLYRLTGMQPDFQRTRMQRRA
jgi:hypothetical protein